MLLAELEIWHSRPIAPTRRIALGSMILPVDPAPGFGGLLIGAVVAVNLRGVDEDLVPDVHRLLGEVDRGERVVQPRLRHRFQVDRHGLAVSRHRLIGDADSVRFEIDSAGGPLQQVLGALYVLERFEPAIRRTLVPTVRRSMTWQGPMGADFVNHLVGRSSSSIAAAVDPRAWALDVLGFPGGTVRFTKREVMDRFRDRLRTAHPDHGGDQTDASRIIGDITEARRVLLDAL